MAEYKKKTFPPSFIVKNDSQVLNPVWLDEAFEMHATYVLQAEKLILDARGKHKLELIPQGPAQRRVIYTICRSFYFLGTSSCGSCRQLSNAALSVSEYYGIQFTKANDRQQIVAFDASKAFCGHPFCEDSQGPLFQSFLS
jgi:hypothetical protein